MFLPPKAQGHRQKRMASLLQEYLSSLFLRGDLPARMENGRMRTLPCPITITHINVSGDLKHAFIFVMPLGGEKQKETIDYLDLIASFLRHQVAKEIDLRIAPILHFKIDDSFERGKRIDELLDDIL